MTLRSSIQSKINTALDGPLADAATPMLLIKTLEGEYDTETGQVYQAESTYSIRGVVSSYNVMQADAEHVRVGDLRILILQSELVEDIEYEDTINITTGKFKGKYNIQSIEQDPASAHWALQVRKIQ
jgi:hypothetical protein